MHTVFWVFIAVAFGLLLFTSVQDKIPDELSFLRADADKVALPGSAPSPGSAEKIAGWF